MTKRTVKIIKAAAGSLITAGAVAAAIYLLWRYEYLSQFACIDNIVGLIPVALAIVFVGAVAALCFIPHKKATAPLSIALAAVIALSAALFPNALRANWWIDYGQSMTSDSQPDISVYEPFKENSKLATLDEQSALILTEDLPQLDGAIALYPLYAAFAQAAYAEEAYTPDRVIMTNTLKAYSGIISGERDVIFVAGSSESQMAEAEKAGAELVFTPIGREAFVFLVADSNPIDNLSYQQIKNIYSGKTANWGTLGWEQGGKIIAYQRPEGSGSQTGIQGVMKDVPLIAPQPLPDRSLVGTNSLMQQITVTWKGVQPALGYSYKYYATVMYSNPSAKLLSIDGVAPTQQNISDGSYPFVVDFYAVTNGQPTGNVKKLIDWILSPQGQELIAKTGYAPLN